MRFAPLRIASAFIMISLISLRASAFGAVKRRALTYGKTSTISTRGFVSSRFNLSSTSAPSTSCEIKNIRWIQDSVLEVISDIFDPAEVARGAALAKLNKKKKGKKKKKEEAQAEDSLSEYQKMEIADRAAADAKPFGIADTMVTLATRPEFGDYQINAALGLSRALKMSPHDCAGMIVEKLLPAIGEYMEEPEIAGPGFINLRFKNDYLTAAACQMAADPTGRLSIPETGKKEKIIVDFSSPNIAKEMHVGHLRSTVIGDTLCNLLEFVGHDVTRLNHVGDWGTQFGMLVEHLRDEYPAALSTETSADVDLGDLVELYKAAKKRFDAEPDFKIRARECVVQLQAGNEDEVTAWKTLCAASRTEYQKIYDLLNIRKLSERGESFYNPYLNDVVSTLEEQGLAVESEGTLAVFLDGYINRDGTPRPMIVRKSDGGFNYATTDLAAIRHRVEFDVDGGGEKADRVLYVTDAGQSQHFDMVFQAAKHAGFVPLNSSLEHVSFGLVQGADGKKFATRSGDTVKLKDLLNESIRMASEDLNQRSENEGVSKEILDRVAKTVGIGAVKYADLSMNRESNYRFSYDRMLSFNGNTAPYMLYAYARICGIIRKSTGQEDGKPIEWPEASEIIVTEDAEVELMRSLVHLPDILLEVERDLYPNKICDYLFETSQKFNKFYEACSVNNASTPEIKASRLSLCSATAGVIRLLLGVIGIDVLEKL